MPTIVFHGDLDTVVNVVNAGQVIAQWAETNDYADDGADNGSISGIPASITQGQVPDGHSYTISTFNDAKGNAIMEQWIVHGMGHAWSGGSLAGSYTDPLGPNASAAMITFFLAHPK